MRKAIGIGAALILAVIFGFLAWFFSGESFTPAVSCGAPVRVENRVYMMTGQWKVLRDGESRLDELLIDFWAVDAKTAQPVYRKRLESVRRGSMHGRGILGVHGDTVWAVFAGGLHALRASTGELLAGPDEIEGRTTELTAMLPRESSYYLMTPLGLKLRAADGRQWYLDPVTYKGTLSGVSSLASFAPTHITASSRQAFMERGWALEKEWIGVLGEGEPETLEKYGSIRGIDTTTRRKVYSAAVEREGDFPLQRLHFTQFRSLTDELLGPGLLAENRPSGPGAYVWRDDPRSVFVLHWSRIDQAGELGLMRVGPKGVIWNVALGLNRLRGVMNGEGALVLYGAKYRPATPGLVEDPENSAREKLVSVDWATGTLSVLDQGMLAGR
jgi:hypothetical protein